MKVLEWGIYLIIFCLPLYLLRFKLFSIPTNVLEVMIGILFIIWLIKGFKFKELKKLFAVHCSLFIAILLILVGVTIATVFSWDLRVSAGIWKGWFIAPLLFFLVLISVIKKPEQVKKIFWAFILSAFVVAAISLVYLAQSKLDFTGRLQGFYNSPNYLAMYLVPGLILSLGLFFTKKKRFLKALLITNCLLLITILFFTKSLGAWLGIIIAFCFGLVLYLYIPPAGGQELKKPRLAWLIVCLGLVLIFLLACLKINVLPQGKSSFEARFVIWQKAWQVFTTYPLIGIGPGTFEDYFPLYPKWGVPQPHNLYLAFLLQTGIIGFIGFIWLLTQFFRKGFKLFSIQHSVFSILLMMVMIYILAHGLIDTWYWKNDLSVLFWMIIGLMFVLSRSLTRVRVEDPRFLNYKKSGEERPKCYFLDDCWIYGNI